MDMPRLSRRIRSSKLRMRKEKESSNFLQVRDSAVGYSMRKRHDLAVQKTLVPEVEVEAEERQANRLKRVKRVNRPGSLESNQIAPEEQLQVQLALEAIHHSPEVRVERIEALRAQIEAGTYRFNSKALAMKLLRIEEQDVT
jgi:flagellar biosynthesis anti-sigma factor FlgM